MSPWTTLKLAGLRPTKTRQQILRLFEENPDRVFSANQVYAHFSRLDDKLSRSTMFRVLSDLVSVRIVTKVVIDRNETVFHLSQPGQHGYLVSRLTGRIEAFEIPDTCSLVDIAEKHGFRVTDQLLILHGEFGVNHSGRSC